MHILFENRRFFLLSGSKLHYSMVNNQLKTEARDETATATPNASIVASFADFVTGSLCLISSLITAPHHQQIKYGE